MKKMLWIVVCCFFSFSQNLCAEESLLSSAFSEVADKVMPATVYIKAKKMVSVQNPLFDLGPFEMFPHELFKKRFGSAQPQIAGGSGFFISPDGFIVTNYHVVEDATEITVHLNDGREFSAELKGSDPKTELAVLKIDEKNLPYLTFGDSDTLRVGEWVVAIGNPLGLEGTLTKGIVSAKGRQDIGIASYEDFIQTDAAINPGNSGGPLLNLKGEVIGVNTAILSKSGGYMGIGFAIPSKIVESIIPQIIDTGTVLRAYLGVMLQPLDKDLADLLSLDKQEGVLIADVMGGSPAEKAGLKSGDVVIRYNGKPVKTVTNLRNEIGIMAPGTKLELIVLRDKKQIEISAILGSELESQQSSSIMLQKLGLEVETLSQELALRLGYGPEMEGVVISQVSPQSIAASLGLQSNFVIVGAAAEGLEQKKISNVKDLEEVISSMGDKKRLLLIVRNQYHQKRYCTLKLQ